MTLFGEIVEPSSRATWEDWDNVPENDDIKLQWQDQNVINEEIDTFYILDGKYFKYFVNTQSHQLQQVNKIKEVHLNLYKIKSEPKYICTVKDYNMVLSSDIVEILHPYLKSSKNVIAIKITPISEYQSNHPSQHPCILRGIYTTKATTLGIEFPKLEQPNILSGVPAGVITLREQLGLAGVAIICFAEYMEDYQAEEIQKMFNKLGIGSIFQSDCSTVSNSNLYI